MSDTKLERRQDGRFSLTGRLNFETVPDLYAAGSVLFAGPEAEVLVDLSGVAHSDSAGVALLVEWMMEARRRGKRIQFLDIPAQMLAIARVSSLDQVLPLGRGR